MEAMINDDHPPPAHKFALLFPPIGIGRFTTEEEVDFAVELLAHHVERLRSMSPLWEMVQEGIDIKSIQWSQDAH